MILRLIIISGIIITGGILLFPEALNQYMNKNSMVNAFSEEMDVFKSEVNEAQNGVSNTITDFENKINEIKTDTSDIFSKNPLIQNDKTQEISSELEKPILVGQVIEKDEENETCKISVPDMAHTIGNKKELTHILDVENCELEIGESVQINESNTDETINESNTDETINVEKKQNNNILQSEFIITKIPQSKIFETLQLSTVENENGVIMINYDDASGKTLKAHVSLRNAETELFSGDFFTSKFQTDILHTENTSHLLEITIEHEEYGTIDSSVFYPTENYNQGFTGIFTE